MNDVRFYSGHCENRIVHKNQVCIFASCMLNKEEEKKCGIFISNHYSLKMLP